MTTPISLWAPLRGQPRFLTEHGFEVHAIASPGDYLEQFAQREGVRVHAIEMRREIAPYHDLLALARLARRLRAIRPDIVIAGTPKGGLLGMIAAWLVRVPSRVYHVRGLPFIAAAGRRRTLLRLSDRVACRLANRVICITPSIREILIEEGLSPAQKVTVLAGGSTNGYDAEQRFNPDRLPPDARETVRARYGIPAEAAVVGFVGRIVRDKGVVELIDAWRSLRERHPELHLLLVGEHEEGDPIPASAARMIADEPSIHLTGWIDDTSACYAAMDILALPSYREGLGNVLMEAAAMRLPAVASDIPGCRDAVVDGVTGTLVPARDVMALTAALDAYLRDAALRQAHGAAGRERVLREFRPEVVWEATRQELVDLLARHRPGRYSTSKRRVEAPGRLPGYRGKRTLDLFLTVPALLALAPIFGIIAFLVRWRNGSPVIFRQERAGLAGRPFTLYKFRTMTDRRDARGLPLPDAERLTRLGRTLRASSLDELPELINVLKGEMSLVGPRPLLLEYLPRYSPAQARRHDALPGLTGWTAVNGRNARSWEEKFALDVWYVDNQSLWLDLRIIAMTLLKIVRREGVSQPGQVTAEPFRGSDSAA